MNEDIIVLKTEADLDKLQALHEERSAPILEEIQRVERELLEDEHSQD